MPDKRAPRPAAGGARRRRRALIAGVVVLVLLVASGITVGVRAALSESSRATATGGASRVPAVNDIALSPDGRRLYATDAAHHRLSVVDTATATRVGDPLTLEGTPWALAMVGDGSLGYVVTHNPDIVWAVDTATGGVSVVTSAPADVVAVSPDGRRLYLGSTAAGTVTVLDTATNAVVGTPIAVRSVDALAVSSDGWYVYAEGDDPHTSSFAVIDTATNTVATSIPVNDGSSGDGNGRHSLAVSPAGDRAYITSYVASTVCVVDTAAYTAGNALIHIGTGTGPTSAAVSPDGKRLFVASADRSQLWIVNTTTGAVGKPTSLGVVPTALAPSPDGRTVYIASRDGQLLALDLQENHLSPIAT